MFLVVGIASYIAQRRGLRSSAQGWLRAGIVAGLVFASFTAFSQIDTDGDGLTDAQETQMGSSPTDAMSLPKTKIIFWGPSSGRSAASIPTNLPSDIVKISAGGDFAVALSSSGRVYAWGTNSSGQTTVPTAATSGVVDVVTGWDFVYARKTDGTLVAWGNSANTTNLPGNIVKMSAQGDQGLLLDANGHGYQRGLNKGPGTANVNTDSNWTNGLTDIGAAGYHHIAAKGGAVKVAGSTSLNGVTTIPSEANSNVRSVFAHGASTVGAILSNNQIVMWGKSDTFQVSGLRNLVTNNSFTTNTTVVRYTNLPGSCDQLVLNQGTNPAIRRFFPTQSYWTGLLDHNGKAWAWGSASAGAQAPTNSAPASMATNVIQASGGQDFVLALVLDQDGDGLADNVETGIGTYVSADNTGTSPTNADTDGDGISDGAEVTAGTDPVNVINLGGETVAVTNSVSYSGGKSLLKTGTNVVVIQGTNQYTGTTTISGGTLDLDGSPKGVLYAVSPLVSSNVVVVNNNGLLKVNDWNAGSTGSLGVLPENSDRIFVDNGTIIFGATFTSARGFRIGSGGATIRATVGGSGTNAYVKTEGTVSNRLSFANGSFLKISGSGNTTFEDSLGFSGTDPYGGSNNFEVQKEQNGTLRLNKTNFYTGTTRLNGGTTIIGAAGSITSSTSTVVATGATLQVDGAAGAVTAQGGGGLARKCQKAAPPSPSNKSPAMILLRRVMAAPPKAQKAPRAFAPILQNLAYRG